MNPEIKNADALAHRLVNDASLRERFHNGDGAAFLEWAKSEGYQFTLAELEAAFAKIFPKEGDVIDEEQLADIAGGSPVLDRAEQLLINYYRKLKAKQAATNVAVGTGLITGLPSGGES